MKPFYKINLWDATKPGEGADTSEPTNVYHLLLKVVMYKNTPVAHYHFNKQLSLIYLKSCTLSWVYQNPPNCRNEFNSSNFHI